MALSHPVIVVPGITATYLRDEYTLPPESIWNVLEKKYERATLHPDDLRYEVQEPARVMPGQLYEVAYGELVEELRHNLREREDRPVPVYPFGYDWRQPLEKTENELAEFVEEVIARTKLLKHYHNSPFKADPKVNLVGHSMGGLVIAGYLAGAGRKVPVNKVATLATPFQGSFEAVIKITTGTANLGTAAPSSRERESARLTPALYHLLPSFGTGLEFPPDLPQSLFKPEVWQPSIRDTIAEFIRLKGLTPRDRRQQAERLFATLLGNAEAHRTRINGFKLSDAGLNNRDWLCVAGVDAVTRTRLKIVRRGGSPGFEFRSSDRGNDWSADQAEQKRNTGDGTVPFEGAVPPFLKLDNMVCITPDDYGYWEWQDRALSAVSGFHGILPKMNMLHRLIVRFFTGRADRHRNTWGRQAPGAARWDPPLNLTRKQ